jgi:hypothetical protein
MKDVNRCKHCRFYKLIDKEKGECFEVIVPANRPAEECPKKAFQKKSETGQEVKGESEY